ncbi:MAG: accessory gene regulator B family protein [bacterium]
MIYLMLLFNLFETILIFTVGYFMGMTVVEMLTITSLFALPRMIFNGASHYKSPLKCLVVSLLLLTSIFGTFLVDPCLSFIVALFTGSIMTERGNIINVYQFAYKKKTDASKYQELIDYLKYNGLSDEYLEVERLLESRLSTVEFKIYDRIFIDLKTWNEVENELDVNRQVISKALDKSYFYLIGRLGL